MAVSSCTEPTTWHWPLATRSQGRTPSSRRSGRLLSKNQVTTVRALNAHLSRTNLAPCYLYLSGYRGPCPTSEQSGVHLRLHARALSCTRGGPLKNSSVDFGVFLLCFFVCLRFLIFFSSYVLGFCSGAVSDRPARESIELHLQHLRLHLQLRGRAPAAPSRSPGERRPPATHYVLARHSL